MKKTKESLAWPDWQEVKLKSAEDMTEFCLKYSCGKKKKSKWLLRQFGILADSLSANEYGIFAFVGRSFNGNVDLTYVITNKRIVFGGVKRLVGESVSSTLLNNVNDIQSVKSNLLSFIEIDTLKEKLKIQVDKNVVNALSDSLNYVLQS